MRKKNPGFMLAERLAKARKEWDGLPVSEQKGLANELLGSFLLLLDLRGEKFFPLFLQKINQLSFNHVDLEMWLNELSGLAGEKVVWRLVVDRREIVGFEREEERSKAFAKARTEAEVPMPFSVPSDTADISDDEREEKKDHKDHHEYGWHTFKERLLEHSQWFGSLSFVEQERRWRAFLAVFSAKTIVKERRVVHLLPFLWRGGFHPHKGLSDPEDAAFLVTEAEEELGLCLSLPERKVVTEAQILLAGLKDKYAYGSMMRRLGMKAQEVVREEKFLAEFFSLKERNNVSELGALVGASLVFSGQIDWLDKFRAVIEEHLSEALVRRLFREEEKKTE